MRTMLATVVIFVAGTTGVFAQEMLGIGSRTPVDRLQMEELQGLDFERVAPRLTLDGVDPRTNWIFNLNPNGLESDPPTVPSNPILINPPGGQIPSGFGTPVGTQIFRVQTKVTASLGKLACAELTGLVDRVPGTTIETTALQNAVKGCRTKFPN